MSTIEMVISVTSDPLVQHGGNPLVGHACSVTAWGKQRLSRYQRDLFVIPSGTKWSRGISPRLGRGDSSVAFGSSE